MVEMPYKGYYQLQGQSAPLGGCLSDQAKLKASDLKYGRLPEKPQEIAVDAMILKSVIEEYRTKMAGFGTQKSFLDQDVTVPNMPDMKIVGITDSQSPCIYGDQSIFINLLANAAGDLEDATEDRQAEGEATLLDYHLKEKDVTLKSGAWPKKPYEVAVNENHKEEMPLNKEIAEKVNGHKLKVTGYYTDKDNSDFLLVSNETVKYNLVRTKSDITACPADKEAAISKLQSEKINVKDIYAESEESYEKEIFKSMRSALIMAGVVLAVSFIEIFLIIRASFLSRVKEVGVYRAIGVKKGDIYKMFLGEILAITTMASVPGYLFMAYIMNKLSGYSIFADMYLVNGLVMVLCAALLYGFNLLFGLLPVFRTMRKRPAAILSRTDIN